MVFRNGLLAQTLRAMLPSLRREYVELSAWRRTHRFVAINIGGSTMRVLWCDSSYRRLWVYLLHSLPLL
jgi:hypothetical protein